jgi:hypothetical protein
MLPKSSNLTSKGRVGHRHYSTAEIIRVIELKSGSIVHIARALGCTRAMIHARAAKDPKIRTAIDNARGLLLDEAEAELAKLVEAGNMTAVIFTLKTIGKHRGYGASGGWHNNKGSKLETAESAVSSFNKDTAANNSQRRNPPLR